MGRVAVQFARSISVVRVTWIRIREPRVPSRSDRRLHDIDNPPDLILAVDFFSTRSGTTTSSEAYGSPTVRVHPQHWPRRVSTPRESSPRRHPLDERKADDDHLDHDRRHWAEHYPRHHEYADSYRPTDRPGELLVLGVPVHMGCENTLNHQRSVSPSSGVIPEHSRTSQVVGPLRLCHDSVHESSCRNPPGRRDRSHARGRSNRSGIGSCIPAELRQSLVGLSVTFRWAARAGPRRDAVRDGGTRRDFEPEQPRPDNGNHDALPARLASCEQRGDEHVAQLARPLGRSTD